MRQYKFFTRLTLVILSVSFISAQSGYVEDILSTNDFKEFKSLVEKHSLSQRDKDIILSGIIADSCTEKIEYILSLGADPNTTMKSYRLDRPLTPLMMVATFGRDPKREESIIKHINLLFTYGAKDNAFNPLGENGFLASMRSNNVQIIKAFLKRKADPNVRNVGTKKSSTLEIAAIQRSFQIVSLLLNAGADPDIKTADGKQTVFDRYEMVRDVLARQQEMNTVETAWRWDLSPELSQLPAEVVCHIRDYIETPGLGPEDKK